MHMPGFPCAAHGRLALKFFPDANAFFGGEEHCVDCCHQNSQHSHSSQRACLMQVDAKGTFDEVPQAEEDWIVEGSLIAQLNSWELHA